MLGAGAGLAVLLLLGAVVLSLGLMVAGGVLGRRLGRQTRRISGARRAFTLLWTWLFPLGSLMLLFALAGIFVATLSARGVEYEAVDLGPQRWTLDLAASDGSRASAVQLRYAPASKPDVLGHETFSQLGRQGSVLDGQLAPSGDFFFWNLATDELHRFHDEASLAQASEARGLGPVKLEAATTFFWHTRRLWVDVLTALAELALFIAWCFGWRGQVRWLRGVASSGSH